MNAFYADLFVNIFCIWLALIAFYMYVQHRVKFTRSVYLLITDQAILESAPGQYNSTVQASPD